MISFIVIGRNEGIKLKKCLDSIINTISANGINYYELIYVDSDSTDNSIDIAKNYNQIKIYKISGTCNAAIGRNVGAKESRGDILCFIDGDIEIIPSFFQLVYSETRGLIHPFVSGKHVDFYYDYKGELISKEPITPDLEDRYDCFLEGFFFLISRKCWFSVGGMKNVFRIGQDYDLGLRLKRYLGLSVLRKKEVAGFHYTVDYLQKDRMWRDLKKGNQLYHRSLLYRKHFFNPFVYKKVIKTDYTLLLLIISIIIMFFHPSAIYLLTYLILLFIKSVIVAKRKSNLFLKQYFYFIARDLINLFGFILFFPKSLKNINYSVIK